MDSPEEYGRNEKVCVLGKPAIQRKPFDYTKWQRKLWKDESIEAISRNAMHHRKVKAEQTNAADEKSRAADFPAQNAIDQAWAEEVERRCIDVDSGKAKLIPGEEVFEKIKKRFSK